jgi:hypothetical protein
MGLREKVRFNQQNSTAICNRLCGRQGQENGVEGRKKMQREAELGFILCCGVAVTLILPLFLKRFFAAPCQRVAHS